MGAVRRISTREENFRWRKQHAQRQEGIEELLQLVQRGRSRHKIHRAPSEAGEVGILALKGFGCRAQDLEPYPPSIVRKLLKGPQQGGPMPRLMCPKSVLAAAGQAKGGRGPSPQRPSTLRGCDTTPRTC